MFMIYINREQNQRTLGIYMNNSCKNLIKSKAETEFKREPIKIAEKRKMKN